MPALEAVENVHRFKDVFIGFISSLASKERPLVIFLDDLQCMYHPHSLPHDALTLSPPLSILSRYSMFHFTLSHIHSGADSNTLNLLLALLTNREASRASYLLIVGAYRDNEVSENHLLSVALREIRSKGGMVEDVSVSALREEQVVQLLDDTFNANNSMYEGWVRGWGGEGVRGWEAKSDKCNRNECLLLLQIQHTNWKWSR